MHVRLNRPGRACVRRAGPTSSGGLEAIEQVNPLNVVGEGRVGDQGLVAVDVVDSKLEGQLVHAH